MELFASRVSHGAHDVVRRGSIQSGRTTNVVRTHCFVRRSAHFLLPSIILERMYEKGRLYGGITKCITPVCLGFRSVEHNRTDGRRGERLTVDCGAGLSAVWDRKYMASRRLKMRRADILIQRLNDTVEARPGPSS